MRLACELGIGRQPIIGEVKYSSCGDRRSSNARFICFRGRRQLLLDDLARFIPDTVARETISQIQSNRELPPVECLASTYPHSAYL